MMFWVVGTKTPLKVPSLVACVLGVIYFAQSRLSLDIERGG